jgi:hydroxypyruvate isomerase
VNYPYLFDVIDALGWGRLDRLRVPTRRATSAGLGWLRRQRARA